MPADGAEPKTGNASSHDMIRCTVDGKDFDLRNIPGE
jgi:hypothetical protein